MSTRPQLTQPEPTTDQPATEKTPPAATPPTRTPTDRAPQTFSRGNRSRLENLIDEWNAGFADSA
jgi:hypothetical protein